VSIGGTGKVYDATVVYFDPQVDLAVLAVPDLPAHPLTFASDAQAGENVAVVGYPEDSGLTVVPGRIRDVQQAAGHDIYGNGRVVREILSMRTQVRPGNSGGPVVNEEGKVVGVVFASSLDNDDTGYAMTSRQVSTAVTQGLTSTAAVGTGSCL
jgi:S1-C subfamily serine protease